MIKTIKHGRPWWDEVKEDDTLTKDMFHDVDMSYSLDGDTQKACHTNLGSFTILNRMTGFGYRDVETGYCDPDCAFWLASGNCDLMWMLPRIVHDVIEYVKKNANTCVAVPRHTKKETNG